MRRIIETLGFAVAILVFASAAFAGQIIHVDAEATGASDGSSWADAFNNLQDALAVTEYGDEIWVAQGTYKPDQGAGVTPGDREATFQLINGAALYGGFPSGGGSWQDRDPNSYETILSGDLNGDDAEVADPADLLDEPTRAENSYHVVTGSGTDPNTVLDGFTITAGNALATHYKGGGMYNKSGSPTLTNCTFRANSAGRGDLWLPSSIGLGGGIYNESSSPVLTNCTFADNSAAWYGGGILNDQSSPKLTNCTFVGNSAGYGGGMCNWDTTSSPTIINCTFSGNSAAEGGGMYNWGANLAITNCIFNGNSANTDGGGMYNLYASSTLTNCTFTGNFAVSYGGGMYNTMESNLTLSSCTFRGNSATNGSGLACDSQGIVWSFDIGPMSPNSSFSRNTTTEAGAVASGPYDQKFPSTVQATNSILWDGGEEIWNNDGSTITVTYSDVQGGWPGEGNINIDPLFVDPGYWDPNGTPADANDDFWIDGDYHLLPVSPCIDAGDPNYIPAPDETDLDGNPRIIDGDEDGEAIVDMGAYEFLPSIEADLRILPRVINRKSRGRYVMAVMRLPEGIAEEDIDRDEGFVLEPGNIESILWRTAVYNEQMRVFVLFEKGRLINAVAETGEVELKVSGQLESGQGIYGVDTIRIIGPPGEHPRGHGRARSQGRAGGRVR